MVKNIAIFASGNGSNTENICNYFAKSSDIRVVLIGANNKDSFVVKRAENLGIPLFLFTKKDLENYIEIQKILTRNTVDFIVLAGFLLKIPEKMVEKYPNKIINIHPALLPKYGGKGMYGESVHKAVLAAGEEESGITIHFVNNKYDAGEIIFKTKCSVEKEDTVLGLVKKIRKLEKEYYPKTIALIIKNSD